MQIEQPLILLPCHSLDDFPIYHEGPEAEELLACWSALWHPAIIAAAGSMPSWRRGDDPPINVQDHLIIVPSIGEAELQAGFVARVENDGGQIVQNVKNLDQAVGAAVAGLGKLTGEDIPEIDGEVVAQFLDIAYGYLQVELLTRQMRYSSSLDQHHFETQLVAAARAAVSGDFSLARTSLTACIDALGQERDHYYPVDVHLVDLTLVAPSVFQRLPEQLQSITNLLISGNVLSQLAEQYPETLQLMKEKIASGDACIVGGEDRELPLPLMGAEAIRRHLICSLGRYREVVGEAPKVYGRRRYGLTPLLPSLLSDLGFIGALHATLDDGQFPESGQTKTRWSGFGDSMIDALGKAPLDASLPQTFLKFAVELGESMDHDHVATRVLAHWPGQTAAWFGSLTRIGAKSPVLGSFVTLKTYFSETGDSGEHDEFRASKYRSPYLQQAVDNEQPNPLSAWVEYGRRDSRLRLAEGIAAINALASGRATGESERLDDAWQSHLDAIESDAPAKHETPQRPRAEPIETSDSIAQLARHLGAEEGEGILVANAQSFVRRTVVDATSLASLPAVEQPIYAAGQSGTSKLVVVDVPPLGFAWIGSGKSRSRKKEPAIVDELTLRNEFFHATIDKTTGALRSLRDYRSRGNRGSQQLVMRFPKSAERSSVMAADDIKVIENGPIAGCISVTGRLLDQTGTTLANYQQRFRVERGNRVLQLTADLEPLVELDDSPWESYFGSRLAWSSDAAEIFTDVHQTRQSSSASRIESPRFVEIDESDRRTLLLTEGLPYHRRIGPRMLDTLLIVRGETARSFRLGIGNDVPYAVREALAFDSPPIVVPGRSQPPSAASTWLMHIDAKNVVASSYEPIVGEEGKCDGLRIRLQETEGRQAKATLRCCRPITLATRQTLAGEDIHELEIEDGAVQVQLKQHQWTQIQARW